MNIYARVILFSIGMMSTYTTAMNVCFTPYIQEGIIATIKGIIHQVKDKKHPVVIMYQEFLHDLAQTSNKDIPTLLQQAKYIPVHEMLTTIINAANQDEGYQQQLKRAEKATRAMAREWAACREMHLKLTQHEIEATTNIKFQESAHDSLAITPFLASNQLLNPSQDFASLVASGLSSFIGRQHQHEILQQYCSEIIEK